MFIQEDSPACDALRDLLTLQDEKAREVWLISERIESTLRR